MSSRYLRHALGAARVVGDLTVAHALELPGVAACAEVPTSPFVWGTFVVPTGAILYKFGGGSYSMTVTPVLHPLAGPPLPAAPPDTPPTGFTGGLRGTF